MHRLCVLLVLAVVAAVDASACYFAISPLQNVNRLVTLANSLHHHQPEAPFYWLLVDRVKGTKSLARLMARQQITLLTLEEANVPEKLLFAFDVDRLDHILPPYAYDYLFTSGYEHVVHLQLSRWVGDSLSNIDELLKSNSLIMLQTDEPPCFAYDSLCSEPPSEPLAFAKGQDVLRFMEYWRMITWDLDQFQRWPTEFISYAWRFIAPHDIHIFDQRRWKPPCKITNSNHLSFINGSVVLDGQPILFDYGLFLPIGKKIVDLYRCAAKYISTYAVPGLRSVIESIDELNAENNQCVSHKYYFGEIHVPGAQNVLITEFLRMYFSSLVAPFISAADLEKSLFITEVDTESCLFEADCISEKKTLTEWFCGATTSWVSSSDRLVIPRIVDLYYSDRLERHGWSNYTNEYLESVMADFRLKHSDWAELCDQTLIKGLTVEEVPQFGVNLYGFFGSIFGLGENAHLLDSLLTAGGVPHTRNLIPIHLKYFPLVEVTNDAPYPILLFAGPDRSILDVKPQFSKEKWDSMYKIALWVWELEEAIDRHHETAHYFDEIWMPTQWQKDIFLKSMPDLNIPIIPLCSPEKKFATDLRGQEQHPLLKEFGVGKDTFVFTTIFDFNSYLNRKNPLATLDAFLKAFTPEDDVVLIFKTLHHETTVHLEDNFKFSRRLALIPDGMKDKVIQINGWLEKPTLDALLDRTNCFVSLHRSEGIGLGVVHSIIKGRPVIFTGFSATYEYTQAAEEDLGDMIVPFKLVPTTSYEGYSPKTGSSRWAEADQDHATRTMRNVYTRYDEYLERARKAGTIFRLVHDHEALAKRVRTHLESIYQQWLPHIIQLDHGQLLERDDILE